MEKAKTVIHSGLPKQYIPENDVYVYFRYNETERIRGIINNNETEQTLNTKCYAESLENKVIGTDEITGNRYKSDETLTIAKKTTLIYGLNRASV